MIVLNYCAWHHTLLSILHYVRVCVCVCVCSTEVLNLARQALYHLSYAPSPFHFSYFSSRVHVYSLGQPVILLFVLPT
jgi:hypothetical protein